MTENKLTIEHLAPYLPYGLKMFHRKKTYPKFTGDVVLTPTVLCHLEYYLSGYSKSFYQPYLRPLSQLTETIEHNGKQIIPIVELAKVAESDNWHDSDVRMKSSQKTHGIGWDKDGIMYAFAYSTEHNGFYLQSVPYKQLIIANQHKLFQMMFSWHFDVFGLLDQNLALPIQD